MAMNKQLCKYSIIRFQPFVETAEFANIGIVLYLPEKNELHFKLLSAREHERITHFFKPLNREMFVATVQIIRTELEQLQSILRHSVKTPICLYDELIRPRESIIQYSQNRVLLSMDIQQSLADLFEHYVKRGFAYKENYEEAMKKRIQALLKDYGFENQFKSGYLGEENKYKVNFPFVDEVHRAAIKPIHFRHSDPKSLIDHGLTWLMQIIQLKRWSFINPENILFTYNAPEEQDGILFEAFSDVKMQIEDEKILIADINEPDAVTAFIHRYHH